VGEEEDYYSDENDGDSLEEGRRASVDWGHCWAEIEVVGAFDTGLVKYIEAEGVAGEDAEVTVAQKDRAVAVEVETGEAEGSPHKEDKGPAEVARGGDDLREGGAKDSGHA
jgi:hypothetical protein